MSEQHHESLIREMKAVRRVYRHFKMRGNRTMVENTKRMIESLCERINHSEKYA